MAWWDDLASTITNTIKSVTQIDKIVKAIPEIPKVVLAPIDFVVKKGKEMVEDATEFLKTAEGKAKKDFTDEENAVFESLIDTGTKIITETAKVVVDPDVRKAIMPDIPKIEMPKITLPAIPTPQDIIKALTDTFKPLVDLLNELVKPFQLLRAQWVPIYDPFTKKVYYEFDDYITLLPTYLAKMGEVAREAEKYHIKYEGEV